MPVKGMPVKSMPVKDRYGIQPKVSEYKPYLNFSLVPLVKGDLLFRFMHSMDTTRTDEVYLRKGLGKDKEGTEIYQRIIEIQMKHDAWKDVAGDWCKNQNVDKCIFHVGIYTDGSVIEVGSDGVENNAVGSRPHYDIVVRFEQEVASSIAATADAAKKHFKNKYGSGKLKDLWYPFKREGGKYVKGTTDEVGGLAYRTLHEMEVDSNEMWVVPKAQKQRGLTGGWIPPDAMNELAKDNEKCSSDKDRYTLAQEVVCSHFVSAVLYAAQFGGTVHAATQPKYDYIFKITPSHLLHQAFTKSYLCMGAEVEGMQHNGEMYPEKHLGKLIDQGDYYCEQLGFDW